MSKFNVADFFNINIITVRLDSSLFADPVIFSISPERFTQSWDINFLHNFSKTKCILYTRRHA